MYRFKYFDVSDAVRTAVEQLKLNENENEDDILITACNADSQFHHQYISALTYQYMKDKYPSLTILYQSPWFHN